MSLPLSVLDLIPVPRGASPTEALASSVQLAQRAEELGFVRHWIAEHHNMKGLASSSPEIVIAVLARETKRIRVGSGGVMLPNHSPLHVAEAFRTLEALYPGRIDLGLGRAPGTDQKTALALRRSVERLTADDFPAEIQELEAYAGEAPFPEGAPFDGIVATPVGVPLPPRWILSSSGYGARLAAATGRGLAFAHHFSPAAAPASMRLYRDEFRPSKELARPYAILSVSVICSETEERAEDLARCVDLMWLRFQRGERGAFPSVEEAKAYRFTDLERLQAEMTRAMLTWGTADQVRTKLLALARELQADELMIHTNIGDPAERLRSYERVAAALRA